MSETPHSTPEEINFHAAVPILRVRSHAVSLDFYTGVLGFRVEWNLSGMASVSRDGCSLMLCEGYQGQPGTWVWIGVGDAEALHREFVSRGVTIRLPPTNHPWALEFHLEDPDGHILRLGSDPKADQPFSPWVAWYEPSAPMPFSDAVAGLLAGDFSRLASLFARSADGAPSPIIRWYEAGQFRMEPDALKEAFTCACFNGCVDVVEHLLGCGVEPAGGMATGMNAFHWAANRGQLEAVRLLIQHRAPMEVRNSYGGTVLACAVWSAVHEPKPEHLRIIETLIEAGASVMGAAYPSGDERIDEILRRRRAAMGQLPAKEPEL